MSGAITQRVIFIDDEADIRAANVQSLEMAGFAPLPFDNAETALAAIDANFDGVVVSDIRMPGMDGLELFRRLAELDPDLPVILISGHSDITTAVAAMHRGAYDFLAKPYPPNQLVVRVKRALEKRTLVLENRRLRDLTDLALRGGPLLGTSPLIENLRRTIQQIADTDIDLVIEGETGTGKGLVAEMLHRASGRKARAMITLDCGALPDTLVESELFGHVSGAFIGANHPRTGRIEQANNSTLFLDTVETMVDATQQKLQRALESREITPMGGNAVRAIDLRVIAASKVDLAALVQAGKFSAPLFYRINGLTLRIPPLRERRGDVPLLFSSFVARAAEKRGREEPKLTPAIWRKLKTHDWPGNVRELQHFADHVVLGLGIDDSDLLTPNQSPPRDLKSQLADYETALIENALLDAKGDVRTAIAALDLPRKTFYDKVKRLGIDLSRFK